MALTSHASGSRLCARALQPPVELRGFAGLDARESSAKRAQSEQMDHSQFPGRKEVGKHKLVACQKTTADVLDSSPSRSTVGEDRWGWSRVEVVWRIGGLHETIF